MKIVRLDEKTRADILEGLLKRDPNHYPKYEETVQQIVEEGTASAACTPDLQSGF